MEHYKDLPEMLHDWYLEAVKLLKSESYNEEAAKPWNELTLEQKFIDEYIAARLKTIFGIMPEEKGQRK